MKKLLVSILAIVVGLFGCISLVGCNGDEKEPELTVEDGVFNRNCTFSMDLNYKSELPEYDAGQLLMLQFVYGWNDAVWKIMSESGDPSERFEVNNIYFLPNGQCVLEQKYTKVINDYMKAMSSVGGSGNTENTNDYTITEGAYRVTKINGEENKYLVKTSIESCAAFEYDNETKLLSGSNTYIEEYYDCVKTQPVPQPVPAAFDYSTVETGGDNEAKYMAMGEYGVASEFVWEKENRSWFSHKIWYPANISETDKKFPLIVMSNGTGTPYTQYEFVFEHLASWGFIVVGNDEPNSALGFASEASLQLMVTLNADENSKFYNKVDIDNVGSMGHSQGGAAAISAVVNNPDSAQRYKAIYAASPSHAAYLGNCFDVSKVNIPFFAIAGTNKDDAENGLGTAPLSSLENLQFNYNSIDDNVTKIIARRQGAGHGDTKTWGDGYAVAWFLWHLQGNAQAQADFKEILSNEKWVNIQNNLQ